MPLDTVEKLPLLWHRSYTNWIYQAGERWSVCMLMWWINYCTLFLNLFFLMCITLLGHQHTHSHGDHRELHKPWPGLTHSSRATTTGITHACSWPGSTCSRSSHHSPHSTDVSGTKNALHRAWDLHNILGPNTANFMDCIIRNFLCDHDPSFPI